MRVTLRLSRKILLLALINIAALAALFLAFAWWQFQLRPESLLLESSRDQIHSIARTFNSEFESAAPEARAGLIANYQKRYHAGIFLTDARGRAFGGFNGDLPEEVLERIRQTQPPIDPPRPAPPPPPQRRGPDGAEAGPPPPPPPPPPQKKTELGPQSIFVVITHNPKGYWVGARIPLRRGGPGPGQSAVMVLHPSSLFNDDLLLDWRPWLGAGLAAAAISLICWLPFLRRLTSTITAADRITEQIALGRFEERVAGDRGDELGHLGRQINRMAAQMDSFVKNQKRFVGDIAHELSSPVARIQFALGILEQRLDEAQKGHLTMLDEEIQEMSKLVNELLSFSKAGLSDAPLPLSTVPVAEVAQRAVGRESSPEASIQMSIEPDVVVLANERLFERALANLVRNAIRYAGQAGPITVSASRQGKDVAITVADRGPGVPENELDQIFTPFYRVDSSRPQNGGAGLGLAIVRTCIAACGGTVVCANGSPSGLQVTIRLAAA
jgi:two-component system, OmpR family, sensor histidine kinase CpxA